MIKDDLSAEDYDDIYLLPDHWILHAHTPEEAFPRLHRYYINRVVELIKQSGAQRVLEVGCGDGWACGQMVKAGLAVTGIDWSKNAIAYASIRVPQATFICGDVRDPTILPDKFDAVALIEVIEHIRPDECVGAIRNIVQHLKTGGTFVLTTPSINVPNTNTQHHRHFTADILRDLIVEAGGLTIAGIEGYGDMVLTNAHYRMSRWIDNRYYQIKPIRKQMWQRFNDANTAGPTPVERCHGLIVKMTKI
jgi:2-polyprenyl-3-methyl-5-hydroxy-6-metoxy-1,4-benzoquinol methylase